MDWKTMTQMDPSAMDAIMKSKETLVLREPVSLDELYILMEQSKDRFPGDFKLKKGLFGTSIVFDKHMDFGAKVQVKEDTVILKRKEPSNNTNSHKRKSIGQLVEVAETAQSAINAVKAGEVSEDLMGGPNYFKSICEAMHELLQSRIV